MSAKLPPLPTKPVFPPEFNMNSDHYRAAQWEYQRARANAWEARCRAAVEALSKIEATSAFNEHVEELVVASHALALIGPLPPGEGE